MNRFCVIGFMISFTFAFFVVELVVGYVTHSLTLISDSYHMLSDVAALCVAIVALKVSSKRSVKNTYGWARADVLGALVNSVFLLALCFTIVVDAIIRLSDNETLVIEHPFEMLYVGIAGLCVNVLGLALFQQHGHIHGGFRGGHHGHSHGRSQGHGNRYHQRHPIVDHNGLPGTSGVRKDTAGFSSTRKTAPATSVQLADRCDIRHNRVTLRDERDKSDSISGRRMSDDLRPWCVSDGRTVSSKSVSSDIVSMTEVEENELLTHGPDDDVGLRHTSKTVSSVSIPVDGNAVDDMEVDDGALIEEHWNHLVGPSNDRRVSDDIESRISGGMSMETGSSDVTLMGSDRNGQTVSRPKIRQNLTMRSVFLHCIGDALGSVLVITSSLIEIFVDAPWKHIIDPILRAASLKCSETVCVDVLQHSYGRDSPDYNSTITALLHDFATVKESALILMQTAPSHIRIGKLKKKLLRKVAGILDVHELHVWQLTGERIIATVHVRCKNSVTYERLAEDMVAFFHKEGIHSLTVQPEFTEVSEHEKVSYVSAQCSLRCDPVEECNSLTCCPTTGKHYAQK